MREVQQYLAAAILGILGMVGVAAGLEMLRRQWVRPECASFAMEARLSLLEARAAVSESRVQAAVEAAEKVQVSCDGQLDRVAETIAVIETVEETGFRGLWRSVVASEESETAIGSHLDRRFGGSMAKPITSEKPSRRHRYDASGGDPGLLFQVPMSRKPKTMTRRRFAEDCQYGDVVEWATPPMVVRGMDRERGPARVATVTMFVSGSAFARFHIDGKPDLSGNPVQIERGQPIKLREGRP